MTGDTSVPVPSHFERIVFEGFKTFLFALARMPFLKLPRDDDDALKQGVEEEWRRVLRYGNGFHGFTVYPRIRIEDLVRYQQLGGGDDLVSWSISNWVIWSMTAFPHPAQTRAPRFGERVFGDRLVRMYEPLVQSYATKIRRRLRGSEKDQPLPPKREVAIALRALLRKLIDEYDFMHGKPKDAVLSSVGAIGSESSAGWRDELEGRFAEFGLPFRAQDVVHVGFARYVVTKFQEHLREHYLWYEPDFAPGLWPAPDFADEEAGDEAAEVSAEEQQRGSAEEEWSRGVPVAYDRDGIDYLYVQQMAFVCHVTQEQLRNWDKRGYLPALRLRDVNPAASGPAADWRVYPNTEAMRAEIEALRDHKQALQAESCEGALSRKEAADLLDISERRLDQMRGAGEIAAVKEGHRVFIPEAEIERILAERAEAD